MSPFVNVKPGAGSPRVRVQGQVGILCLPLSRKLSGLLSSPQRGFQTQMSPRPDKAVTAPLQGGWTHSRAETGFAGTSLQQDRMEIRDWGCRRGLALGKRVAPCTVAPAPLVLLPTLGVFQQRFAFTVPGAGICKISI